ncbi:MAG: hypothetical protein JKX85_06985 [Phycisphaeraceae bacterium]|nr:hypothetical protein [Phycisphaeraceae bacterium]
MAEDFYKQWLGINASTHEPDMPPDHYTLLGLPHFCHHPEAVEISAKQRLENLDKFAMLPDRKKREAATRIMNEVATARVALSDPKNFQRYDQLLSQKLGIKVPDKEVPPPSNLLPLLQDQQAYELDLGDDVSDAPGIKPLDASLAEMDGPEIHAEADFNATRTVNSNPIPFTAIILSLSVLFLLILGIVIGAVMLLSDDESDAKTQFKTTVINPKPADDSVELLPVESVRSNMPQKSEDRKLGKPDVSDDYDRLTLGNSYRVRATAGRGAKIENKKLAMTIGGNDNGETRVEYTPMQADVPIKQVNFNLTLDSKSTFVFALANGRIRLTLKFTGSQLTVAARPGGPATVQTQYPTITTDGKNINIRARRTPDSILWYINELPVAISPAIDPRETATATFSLLGTPGSKAFLDNTQVWYPQ